MLLMLLPLQLLLLLSRNIYNKVYGGFIMRKGLELAWANAFNFTKSRPQTMHMDDILFR